MAEEIERKFLVSGHQYRSMSTSSSRIRQGYICRESGRTVRVRIRDERGYLTIKGPSRDGGLVRFEWETEISLEDARQMMLLVKEPVLEKTRYLVPFQGHVFEVDEFHGDNEGLVVAEVELSDVTESFQKPLFLDKEVTGERRYYNSELVRCPFREWKDRQDILPE